jgi:hypothetical protein
MRILKSPGVKRCGGLGSWFVERWRWAKHDVVLVERCRLPALLLKVKMGKKIDDGRLRRANQVSSYQVWQWRTNETLMWCVVVEEGAGRRWKLLSYCLSTKYRST